MKLSSYFSELSSAYAYEIEDLTYDSGGEDVLKSRLKVKRNQFADLLMMISTDPVMVAPAFHRAFQFESTELLDQLVAAKPDDFPKWAELAESLKMEPWAKTLTEQALKDPAGEEFLLVTVGLEYIYDKLGATAAAGQAGEDTGSDAEDDEDDVDLGEAGEDFLGEQGFDRRS